MHTFASAGQTSANFLIITNLYVHYFLLFTATIRNKTQYSTQNFIIGTTNTIRALQSRDLRLMKLKSGKNNRNEDGMRVNRSKQ